MSNLPTVPTPVTFKSGTSIPLIVVVSFWLPAKYNFAAAPFVNWARVELASALLNSIVSAKISKVPDAFFIDVATVNWPEDKFMHLRK